LLRRLDCGIPLVNSEPNFYGRRDLRTPGLRGAASRLRRGGRRQYNPTFLFPGSRA
jgi:hypothetical protein